MDPRKQLQAEMRNARSLARALNGSFLEKVDQAFRGGRDNPANFFLKLYNVTTSALNEDEDTVKAVMALTIQQLSLESKFNQAFFDDVLKLYLETCKAEVPNELFSSVLASVKTNNPVILSESVSELASLREQAAPLAPSLEEIEKRQAMQKEREELSKQIFLTSVRSPKTKKRFLEENADKIADLYKAYENENKVEELDKLERTLTENYVKPIQSSLLGQAKKEFDSLKQAIEKGPLNDRVLQKASRTISKIIKNLGEDSPIATIVMQQFSGLMVKAHEKKAQFDEIRALGDEIDKMTQAKPESPAHSSTASLLASINPPSILTSASVPDPLEDVLPAIIIRADTSGLSPQQPIQQQDNKKEEVEKPSIKVK